MLQMEYLLFCFDFITVNRACSNLGYLKYKLSLTYKAHIQVIQSPLYQNVLNIVKNVQKHFAYQFTTMNFE